MTFVLVRRGAAVAAAVAAVNTPDIIHADDEHMMFGQTFGDAPAPARQTTPNSHCLRCSRARAVLPVAVADTKST